MSNYQPTKTLQTLVNSVLTGTVDSQQLAELDGILRADQAARRWYLQEIRIHGALTRWASDGRTLASDPSTPDVEEIIHHQRRNSFITAMVSAVAILLIALVTMYLINAPEEEDRHYTFFQIATDTTFTLTHSQESEVPLQKQVLIEGSRLQIATGVADITFPSGVAAVVQGPADIIYRGEGELQLDRGTAWFQVPANAKGFTVVTPELEVVDLGTEFGIISTLEGGDQVHVFKGSVMVHDLDSQTEKLLTSGHALKQELKNLIPIKPHIGKFYVKLPTFSGRLYLNLNDDQKGVRCNTIPHISPDDDREAADDHWGFSATSSQALASSSQQVWSSRQDKGEDPPMMTVYIDGLQPGRNYDISLRRPVGIKNSKYGNILAGLDQSKLTLWTTTNSVLVPDAPVVKNGGFREMLCSLGTATANRFGRVIIYIDNDTDPQSRSYISAIGICAQ